jgi:hypothetical protein
MKYKQYIPIVLRAAFPHRVHPRSVSSRSDLIGSAVGRLATISQSVILITLGCVRYRLLDRFVVVFVVRHGSNRDRIGRERPLVPVFVICHGCSGARLFLRSSEAVLDFFAGAVVSGVPWPAQNESDPLVETRGS